MKAKILPKSGNDISQVLGEDRIVLTKPSVVQVQIGPEQVARFDREGNDLLLVLKDGTVLVIENFFVQTADGRNDLVMEDAQGVLWWAQYGERWTGFDIAEIDEDVAGAFLPPVALGGLAALVGGAAVAGGLGGGGKPGLTLNNPPVGTGDSVTTAEDTAVSGTVTATDDDGDDLTFTLNDGPSHGDVSVNPDGTYEYTPDPDYHGSDSFTVTVDDGKGGTDTVTVDVTVTPVNDPATITGDVSGAVVEAGGVANGTAGAPSASGTLSVSDADAGEAAFVAPPSLEGTYGTFTFDEATGEWSYTLDDARGATEELTAGEVVTDSLVVTSLDGTASETVTVTITGTNDVPVVSDDSGSVVEDDDGGTGVLSTDGQVTIADADAGESLFDPTTLAATGAPLGTLDIDAAGNWSYEVDNTLPQVQGLGAGETITETWTVGSVDGTATSTIVVTIRGTNDAPEIEAGGDVSASVTEIADGATGENATTHSQGGTLVMSDLDASDGLSVSVSPDGTGYLGDFSHTVDAATGEIDWSFAVDDADLDALGAGETLTQSYEVTVTDPHGATASETVTVTITGTNDVPVVSDDSGSVVEDDDGGTGVLSTDGQVTIADADAGESLFDPTTLAATGAPLGTLDIDAAGNWSYEVDNTLPQVQGLGAGETITETWTVGSVDGTATSTIVVTIRGTNDAPEIEAGGDVSASVTEIADGATGENATTHSQGGTLVMSDLDASDGLSVSVSPDGTGYLGDFSHTVDAATGEIDWSFAVDDADLDALGAGETLTQSYEVTVTDPHGATATETVTVTITGTNDVPVVSDDSGSVVEDDDGGTGVLSTDGQVTIADADAGESLFDPTTLAATGAPLGTLDIDAAGNWSYEVDNTLPQVQGLGAGETITETWTVGSVDGTATSTIVVTIRGTNDAPEIEAGGDVSASVTEIADGATGENATTHSQGGTLVMSDLDASDGLSVSVSPDGTGYLGDFSHTVDAATGEIDWSFAVDDADLDALGAGETLTQSYEVTVTDPHGATATETVTVTITGTNDVPVVSDDSGSVVEDDDGGTGVLSTDGQVTIADADAGESLFDPTTLAATGAPLGTLDIDAAGNWSYEVDNTLPQVQGLGAGETITETWTVGSVDGTATSTIVVTIRGTNDAPEIEAGGDVSASVTEIADGATGENATTHSQGGTLVMSDLDASDGLSVSVSPDGTGYLGDFSHTVDAATGEIDWSFAVDDADLDALGAGETLTQSYEVTVTDPHGATATETVTVTITGTNDQPEPQDDNSLIVAGGGDAVLNVTTNDADDDDGEAASLQVTEVDGQPITAGGSVTLSGERGTVSLNADGQTLTFTPGPNGSGELILPYTVDDGSGATDATATADWIINVADVAITDDASPAGATTPDDVLSSVDDLEHVAINGHAAAGGEVTSLTISDGTNSVTVLAGDITINADGSYSATADLRGLDDGTLTVTADIEDAAGNTATTTDTIDKDTTTPVTIDPVLIQEGVVPTISGTGEPGAEITLTVGGDSYNTTVGTDGTWSVDLPAALDGSDVSITADAEDEYGNTNSTTRDVTGLEVTDTVAGEPEDIVVFESALTGGSDAASDAEAVSATFDLGTVSPALDHLVIGGTVAGGAVSGGTTISLADLTNASGVPVNVSTEYGTLTITDYDPGTGVISYTYTLNGSTTDHDTVATDDAVSEAIQIAAVETDGDTRVSELVVGVEDDAPLTPVANTPATVVEGGAAVGSSSGGENLLDNDTLGADGGRVHEITYTNDAGDSITIAIPDGGSETVNTQHGSLTVHSDGTWFYTPDASVDHVKPGSDTELRDDFSYTTIDADGDVSPGAAIQQITVTDTVPDLGDPDDASISEEHLATGTAPDASQTTVGGSLDLTVAQDTVDVKLTTASAPSGLTSGNVPVQYSLSGDGHTLTAHTGNVSDPVFVVTLTDPTNASAGYTFELIKPLDHDGDPSMDLTFGVEVEDSDNDTDTAEFTVTVVDDAPETVITRTINEEGSFSYNISADATATNTGITQGGVALPGTANTDGSVEYKTEHGTVTISADGELTYEADLNFSGTEEFQVVTPDDVGAPSSSTVTVDVNPVADAPTLAVGAGDVGTEEDTAVALGLSAPVVTDDGTGTGNNTTPERIGEITLSGLPEGATLDWGGGTHVVDDSGSVTIKLTNVDTVSGTTGDLEMTSVQFEALEILPPAHASENFTVTYEVTSYEVDATGVAMPGVTGATSSNSVTVYVEAVTDDAILVFDTTVDETTVDNAERILYGSPSGGPGNTAAIVEMHEDTSIDIADMLAPSFDDLDGSEVRSFTITNNTGHTIVVNGTEVEDGDELDVPAEDLSDGTTGLPEILVGGTPDFSGELSGITVTLNAQDKDADGYLDGSTVVPGGVDVDGVAEANTGNNSVTLDLRVFPVADDVVVGEAEGDEDNEIAFLDGVSVTDTSTGITVGGSEIMYEVSFTAPAGWTVIEPSSLPTGVTVTENAGEWTISFLGSTLDQAGREAVLGDFGIAPPAHYSGDVTIPVTIKAMDNADIGHTITGDIVEATHDLVVTVNPVAEVVETDTDGNTSDDLTMTPGFVYSTAAVEDEWFDLNSDGFNLIANWANEDSSEETFARLTPELLYGDGTPADATGSTFRWMEGGTMVEVVFDGSTPIDVPVDALDTLEFRAASDFSGQFQIKVEALTVDSGDDGLSHAEAVSGEAYLQNVLITPEADDVTVALVARTQGLEDQPIQLSINPTSSDPSETFTITISDIPAGSVLTYNGSVLTVTGDSVTIEDFDPSAPFTLQPPENSNQDFTLTVSAVSVDELDVGGTIHSDTSDPTVLTMEVDMRGVADAAEIELPTVTPTYVEDDLDSGSDSVLLADLVSVGATDDDGSETLTLQITGLPEGFAPSQGTMLTGPDVTGEDRVWVIQAGQLATTEITVPENFSGDVEFSVVPVTTENDGASLTGTPTTVSFNVTPSPEATVTTGAVLSEDIEQAIDLSIVHQNGDTDEELTAVAIKVDDVIGADFTLFVGGTEISAAVSTITVGGVDYYELTPAQVAQLTAQGAPHLDGNLGGATLLSGFDLLYQITDPGEGSVAAETSDWIAGHFDLSATPVTDQPVLTVSGITLVGSAGTVTGNDVTVTSGGEQVTLNLNIATPDSDGSEHVIRVILDNVPEGVSVQGGEMLGGNQWLLLYEGDDALPLDDAGGLVLPVTFTVSNSAGGQSDVPIGVTVQTQDRGDQAGIETAVLQDSITWTLTTDFAPGSPGQPPVIDTWEYTGESATEDTSFQLSEMINAEVSLPAISTASILTVTLADLPPGTEVTGMTRTVVDGQEVWTASIVTDPTDDEATVNAALDALLASITLQAEENANYNNAAAFTFDATLTSAAIGGSSDVATIEPVTIPVVPVTDPADVSISLGAADADGELTETDTEIPLTITVSNPADGAAGSIASDLYLQIDGTNGLGAGVLTLGGTTYSPQAVSGVTGIPDGTYYVISGVDMGETLDLVFTPDTMTSGEVTVEAWVRNQETDGDEITSTGVQTLPVEISNDGVTFAPAPASGAEAADSTSDSLIEIDLSSLTLVDDDGSEEIVTVLLSNLPEGFLVFTGTNPGDASISSMATNAGGAGGVNTWVLTSDGDPLPAYIGILPPKHWSGTLDDLELNVVSGETALSDTQVQVLELDDVTVTPVANGISLSPTNSFGPEGSIIPLNLNASMVDFADASVVAAADESMETATLQLQGLGEHASFYIGTDIVTSGVSYHSATDTYTLTGLSQSDLDQLGFVQAASALSDMDGGTAGLQINVTATTEEGGNVSASTSGTMTLNLSAQLPTTGGDSLIWTGGAIDGRGGEDVVHIRHGESLSGTDLATQLDNIEQIDLGIEGGNQITDLSPENVEAMTDGANQLTISGTAADSLFLSGDWTDNGDGTYTGTLAGGSVTLAVEDVSVTSSGGGTAGRVASPFIFSFDEAEGIGLAGIDGAEDSKEEHDESMSLSLDDVLGAEASDEDPIAGLLQEEDGGAPASSGTGRDAGGSDWGGVTPGSALDDELLVGSYHEV